LDAFEDKLLKGKDLIGMVLFFSNIMSFRLLTTIFVFDLCYQMVDNFLGMDDLACLAFFNFFYQKRKRKRKVAL